MSLGFLFSKAAEKATETPIGPMPKQTGVVPWDMSHQRNAALAYDGLRKARLRARQKQYVAAKPYAKKYAYTAGAATIASGGNVYAGFAAAAKEAAGDIWDGVFGRTSYYPRGRRRHNRYFNAIWSRAKPRWRRRRRFARRRRRKFWRSKNRFSRAYNREMKWKPKVNSLFAQHHGFF